MVGSHVGGHQEKTLSPAVSRSRQRSAGSQRFLDWLKCSCAPGAAVSLRGKGRRLLSDTSDQCLPGVLKSWGLWLQLHLQLLPFLIGRDSSVGEGGDPNQKEENRWPQKEPVQAARAQWASGNPSVWALSRSRAAASPLLALGLSGWLSSHCLQWRCHSQKLKDYYSPPSSSFTPGSYTTLNPFQHKNY